MSPEPRVSKAPGLATQVSRAVIWNTLFVPFKMLTVLLATLLKLTVLSPAGYGLLSLISSTTNLFGTWIDLGTGRALPKFIPETLQRSGPRAMRRLVLAVLGAQFALLVIVSLGFLLFWEPFLAWLRTKTLDVTNLDARTYLLLFIDQRGPLIILAVLLMLLMGIGYDVLMAYLSSFFKQKAWNIVALSAGLLPPLLTSVAILAGWNVAGVLLASVLAPTIATALAAWQVLRHQRELDAFPASADTGEWLPAGFVRYAAVSLLMTATDFLASADFVVFFVKGLVDVAIMKAGVSIVRMMLDYLYTPMVGVQVPLFTRVRAGEGGTLNGAYQSIVRLQLLFLVPGGIGLILLARSVFALLFPNYVDATPLVWVLVPCLFLECLLTTAHNVLIVYERLSIIIISRVLTLVSVPLVLVLTPQLGLIGAALAFGLARVLAGLWVTASGMRLLGLRWPWKFSWRVLLASIIMAVLVGLTVPFLPEPGVQASILDKLLLLPWLAGIALAGAVSFLAALRLLGGLEPQDREQLLRTRIPFKRWIV